MEVKIKLLTPTAKMPTRGSSAAAGYDVYADISAPIVIAPHDTVKVSTGIAVSLPDGTFGGLFARSGLATKKGLRLANSMGVIDADYRGAVITPIHNDSNSTQVIQPQERIAQLVVLPFIPVEFEQVEELDETARGEGGFGSTGKL